ncbi:hypothetical protein GC163_19105 [bacterium]|nr:hypothetical protein [bacterium]
MDTEPQRAAEATEICRFCGTLLEPIDLECPQGHPRIPPGMFDPLAAVDIGRAVLMGLVASGLTLPATAWAIQSLPRWDSETAFSSFLASTINLAIWGFPAYRMLFWWRQACLLQEPSLGFLWRLYWKSELLTIGCLLSLLVLLVAICTIGVIPL